MYGQIYLKLRTYLLSSVYTHKQIFLVETIELLENFVLFSVTSSSLLRAEEAKLNLYVFDCIFHIK